MKLLEISVLAGTLVVCLTSCTTFITRPTTDEPDEVAAAPTEAVISLELTEATAFPAQPGTSVGFGIAIIESGGVGGHIDFVRAEAFRSSGELEERREKGAGAIIKDTGSNRLEAFSFRDLIVLFAFKSELRSGRKLLVTVGFSDDLGNRMEWSKETVIG